jgi:hypothetical protein
MMYSASLCRHRTGHPTQCVGALRLLAAGLQRLRPVGAVRSADQWLRRHSQP